ncbi:MAG: hypothetical protein V1660_00910 [archaeon]
MAKHFPKEDIEALKSMINGDYKKKNKELMDKGVCIYKPELSCNKAYECVKMDDYHEESIKSHRFQQKMRNPFANHTTFFATSRPGFYCSDLEERINKKV